MSNDAVTTVAGMAGRTSRIVIGTGIANIYLRHPVMLGIAAAAIDELAAGRLVLGLGPNNAEMITRAGLTWRDPRQALRETTETLRGVFAGQGVPGLRSPRPAVHPIPVHWAAMALETCEAAGAHADGLMLYLCSRERYRRAVERMRRGAETMRRNPADIAVSVLIPAFVHDDLPTARQAAREFLVHYAGMPHYAKAFEASGFGAEMKGVRDGSGCRQLLRRDACALRSAARRGAAGGPGCPLSRTASRVPGGGRGMGVARPSACRRAGARGAGSHHRERAGSALSAERARPLANEEESNGTGRTGRDSDRRGARDRAGHGARAGADGRRHRGRRAR